MGFVSMSPLFRAFVALQLLVSVYGHVDDPSPPPAPAPPPPVYFPATRMPVAVHGVVYCRPSCKHSGLDVILSLKGAGVQLKCNNGKRPIVIDATAGEDGYFFIKGPPKKLSTFGVHKCRVFLVSSPADFCNNATDFNGGLTGAILYYERPTEPIPYTLYTVGPFAYGPTTCFE